MPEAQEELHQQAAPVGQQALLETAGTSIKEAGPPFLVPPQAYPA